MGIVKIDKDEVNKLLKKAKKKATDVIGKDNMNALSDIGKTVVNAGNEIKDTLKENYGDQFNDVKNKIVDEAKEFKNRNFAQNTNEHIKDNTKEHRSEKTIETEEEKLEKQRIAEEKRIKKEEEARKKVEKQRQKEEEEKRKREQWWKKNKILVYIGSTLVALAIVGIIVGVSISNRGKISIGFSSTDLQNKNYVEVVENLKERGFKNIKLVKNPDLILGFLNSDGDIESVSINNSTTFSSSSKFYPNDMITITYHTFPEKDEEIKEETESKVDENEIIEVIEESIENEPIVEDVISTHFTKNEIPMVECSLNQAVDVCFKHGLSSSPYDDLDVEDGTMFKDMSKSEFGLSTTIVYDKETKEVVTISVVPMANDTHKEQESYILDLASICCSPSYAEEVQNWFSDNFGNEAETTIDGIVYSISVGICDNYCASFGEGNWEEWSLSNN